MRDPLPSNSNSDSMRPKEGPTPRWVKAVVLMGVLVLIALAAIHHLLGGGHVGHAP